MKQKIMSYINRLESYKTAIKNLHWSSKHMSEHKLLDDIADSLSTYQDEIAEVAQGIYGKIKLNELRPKKYSLTNSKKMLIDLLDDTKKFHPSTKSKELIGLRSVVESFMAEVSKFQYLMDMCLKEDIKRNFDKKAINENNEMKKQIKLSEQDLHDIVKESVKLVLNEEHASFGSIYDDDYLELIPLFDIFVGGYALGSDRDEILQEPLYDKNGNEIGYCLNDLNVGYMPNAKR